MKTRIIHTKLWDDDFFINLTIQQKIIFIYLMTNSLIGLTGMYEISDRRIRFDLGIDQDEIDKAKKIFENAGKIAFKDGWVYVTNAQKYGGYISPKLTEPIKNEISLIPSKILEFFKEYAFNHSVSIVYPYSIDTPINHKSEIINNKLKIINNKEERIYKKEEGYEIFNKKRKELLIKPAAN